MDGLALAVGAGVDTIVDIATLTGAALMALGKSRAPVPGNNRSVVDQVVAAARRRSVAASAGAQYRKQLDSDVADISNSAARTPGHHGRTVPRRARGRHPLGSHRHRRHHVHRCGRRLALRRRHRFCARLASPSTSPPGRTWGRFLLRSNVPPEPNLGTVPSSVQSEGISLQDRPLHACWTEPGTVPRFGSGWRGRFGDGPGQSI